MPGIIGVIGKDQLKGMIEAGKKFYLLDVRGRDSFEQEHIAGAVSLPVEKLKLRLKVLNLSKSAELVTYCGGYMCNASLLAAEKLIQLGYKNIKRYEGGIKEWKEYSFPTTSGI